MKRLLVTFLLVLICLGLVGCAGSKVHVANFDLGKGKGKIAVMPWSKAKKKLFANDADRRNAILQDTGVHNKYDPNVHAFVDSKTGLFTYTFDKNDYANLRESVIQSLIKSGAFSDVIDVSDAQPPADGHRLVLEFAESGIVQTPATSKCILNGTARLEGDAANDAPASKIVIEATSLLSVSGAKSKAMKMYLAKVGELLKGLE